MKRIPLVLALLIVSSTLAACGAKPTPAGLAPTTLAATPRQARATDVPTQPEPTSTPSAAPWRIIPIRVQETIRDESSGWKYLEVWLALENISQQWQVFPDGSLAVADIYLTTAEGYRYPIEGGWGWSEGSAFNSWIGTGGVALPPGFRASGLTVVQGNSSSVRANHLVFKVAQNSRGYKVHIPGYDPIDLDRDVRQVSFPSDIARGALLKLGATLPVLNKGSITPKACIRKVAPLQDAQLAVTVSYANASAGYDTYFQVTCLVMGNDGVLRLRADAQPGASVPMDSVTVGPGQILDVQQIFPVTETAENLHLILTGDVQAVYALDCEGPAAEPIAVVNGKPITTGDYQAMVKYRRFEQTRMITRLQDQLARLDPTAEDQQFLVQYLQQQIQQLQYREISLPTDVLDDMIDDELVRQETGKRNITVAVAELQEEIEQQFGYIRNPPTPTPTPITATVAITLTPTPTEAPMTLEAFQENYSQYVVALRKNANFGETAFRRLFESTLYRTKLQDALAEEVPLTAEQVHARHILLKTEEDAKKVLERLQAGEDFSALAKELSEDTGSKEEGGDLGWFPRGQMVTEFEEAAFALQPGQTSAPVQTSYRYHIINVIERDANRPLNEDLVAQNKSAALEDWLTEARKSDTIKRYWSSDKVPPLGP